MLAYPRLSRQKPATRSPDTSPLPIAALPTYKVLEGVYWWVRGVINQPAASAAARMARMSSSRRRRMERYRRSSMASAFDSVDGVVPTVPPATLPRTTALGRIAGVGRSVQFWAKDPGMLCRMTWADETAGVSPLSAHLEWPSAEDEEADPSEEGAPP